ncbi:hypothetical protein RclHR1_03380005 [Rhizophagus clarus]|uniref:F-box domain-containing protein n=1 Tax=Rhizophagus clarus TaxID=94130 RepID=A0A2Z6RA13_9GLOM|nr:hypothetical protein RclHR1_03380005 [Rhizophagus clarus]GES94780.1 hypothetical protein GLOIN_2v1778777 [Rhizophagus clarus]
MPKLLIEIMTEILSYVEDDDINTLHSIILINKDWLQVGISYLWKKPFNVKYPFKNLYKIITIILFYIDEKQKNILKIKDLIPTKILFDYPYFIKQMDFNELFKLIKIWLNNNKPLRPNLERNHFINNNEYFIYDHSIYHTYSNEGQEILAFFESIFYIIIKRSKGIENLFIDINKNHYEKTFFIPNDYFSILFKGIKEDNRCFIGLKEFVCDGNFHKAFIIDKIKECSREINHLKIYPWENSIYSTWNDDLKSKNIKELLQIQKNLKSLTYSTVTNFGRDTMKGLKGMVQESLEIFKIHGDIITDDELKYLKKCKKLKKLSFILIDFNHPNNILTNIQYPELEIIEFTCCNFTRDALENMKVFIRNNGKNLKEIQLNQDLSRIPGILLSFSENCYNLVNIFVNIKDRNNMLLLLKIMSQCKNLQKIHVGCDGKPKFLADPFMNEFTHLCSSNLVELNISNWRISLNIFETVIEKCITFLKVLKISCDGNIKDLEIMVQIFSEFHGRILKGFSIQENNYDFDNLKLVEMIW